MTEFTIELSHFVLTEEGSQTANASSVPASSPAAGATSDVTASDPRTMNPNGKLYARMVFSRKAIVDSTRPSEICRDTGAATGRKAEWSHACIYVPGTFDDEGGFLRDKRIRDKAASVAVHWIRAAALPDQWTRRAKDPDRGWHAADPQVDIDLSDALRVLSGDACNPCTAINDAKKRLEELAAQSAAIPTHNVAHTVELDGRRFRLELTLRAVPDAGVGHEVVQSALARALALLAEVTPRKTYPKATEFFVELLERLRTLVEATRAGPPDLKTAATGQLVPFADVMRSKTARLSYDRGADYRAVCRTTHDWAEYLATLLLHDSDRMSKASEAVKKAAASRVLDTDRVALGAGELDRCAPTITSLAAAAGLQEEAAAAAQAVIDGVQRLPLEPPSLRVTAVSSGGGAGTHSTAWRSARDALSGAAQAVGGAVHEAGCVATQAMPFVAPVLMLALRLYELSTQSDEMLQVSDELLAQIGLMVPVLTRDDVRSMLLQDSTLRGLMFAVFGAMERAQYVHDAFAGLGKLKRMLTVSSLRPELDKCAQDVARAQAALSQAVGLTAAADASARFTALTAGQRALLREAVEAGERDERAAVRAEEDAEWTGTVVPLLVGERTMRHLTLTTALQTLEIHAQPRAEQRLLAEEQKALQTLEIHEQPRAEQRLLAEEQKALQTLHIHEQPRAEQRLLAEEQKAFDILVASELREREQVKQHDALEARAQAREEAARRTAEAAKALADQEPEPRAAIESAALSQLAVVFEQAALTLQWRSTVDEIMLEEQQEAVLLALRIHHAQRYVCMPFFMGELSSDDEKRLATFAGHYTPIAANTASGKDESRHDSVEAAWSECAAEAARLAARASSAKENESPPQGDTESGSTSTAEATSVRVFVEAEAGSGKSTAVKWLALNPASLRGPTSATAGSERRHLGCVVLVDLPTLLKRELEKLDKDPAWHGRLRAGQNPADDPDWPALLVRSLTDTAAPQAVSPGIAAEGGVSTVLRARAADVLYVFDGFDEVSAAVNRSASLGLLLRRLHGGAAWACNVLVTSRPERATSLGAEDASQLLLFHGFARLRLLPWRRDAVTHYLKRFPWPSAALAHNAANALSAGGSVLHMVSTVGAHVLVDDDPSSPAAVAFRVLESDSFGSALAGLPLMVHLVCCIVHPKAAWRHARRNRLSVTEAQKQLESLTPVTAMERLIDSVLEWQARKAVMEELPDIAAWRLEDELDRRYPQLQASRPEKLATLRRRAYETTLHGGLISMTPEQFEELESTSLMYCVDLPKPANGYYGQYRFLHKSMAQYLCACHIVDKLAVDPAKIRAHFAFTTERVGDAAGAGPASIPISNVDRPRLGEAVVLLFLAELLLGLSTEDARSKNVVDALNAAMDEHLHSSQNRQDPSSSSGTSRWPTANELDHATRDEWFRVEEATHLAPFLMFHQILSRRLELDPESPRNPHVQAVLKRLVHASLRRLPKFMQDKLVGNEAWFLMLLYTAGAYASSLKAIRFASVRGVVKPSIVDRAGAVALERGERRGAQVLQYLQSAHGFSPSLAVLLQLGGEQAMQLAIEKKLVTVTEASFTEAVRRAAFSLDALPALDIVVRHLERIHTQAIGGDTAVDTQWIRSALTYDFFIQIACSHDNAGEGIGAVHLDASHLPRLPFLSSAVGKVSDLSSVRLRSSVAVDAAAVYVELSSLNFDTVEEYFLAESPVSSVTFADGWQPTTLGQGFLCGCKRLSELRLPPSFARLTSLEPGFLARCSALRRVDFSAPTPSIRGLGGSFLRECTGMVEVDLSGLTGLEVIGQGFLQGCNRLKMVHRCSMATHAEAAVLVELATSICGRVSLTAIHEHEPEATGAGDRQPAACRRKLVCSVAHTGTRTAWDTTDGPVTRRDVRVQATAASSDGEDAVEIELRREANASAESSTMLELLAVTAWPGCVKSVLVVPPVPDAAVVTPWELLSIAGAHASRPWQLRLDLASTGTAPRDPARPSLCDRVALAASWIMYHGGSSQLLRTSVEQSHLLAAMELSSGSPVTLDPEIPACLARLALEVTGSPGMAAVVAEAISECASKAPDSFATDDIRGALLHLTAVAGRDSPDCVRWVATAIANATSGERQSHKDVFATIEVQRAVVKMMFSASAPTAIERLSRAISNILENADRQDNKDLFATKDMRDALVAAAAHATTAGAVQWLATAICSITNGSRQENKDVFATAAVRDALCRLEPHASTSNSLRSLRNALELVESVHGR